MIIKSINDNLQYITECFMRGEIIVLPTDTLFALSCDASNAEAVRKIFEYKVREKEKSLPVFFANIEQIRQVCEVNNLALNLAERFWPGALTLVLPIKNNQNLIAENVYNNGESLAVRIPDSAYLQKIIKELDKPIVATSANISGHAPVKDSAEALKVFDERVVIIEGKSKHLPSTIVKINDRDYKVIREGQIKINQIEEGTL
ncbi:putative yrdC domain-containing protein [endosymbiont of Acanthamoeba sp. UWC8]|uniref:L-threonylcarbamoyladenylate synthase n=1 Tax=endosymbiont of Acanthamoeba sp. UWC8 TaxID=86106 RepID=UPI0004D0EA71|nr:L-threonylcarbamoyladenylate synthase [endosymbiont of Acanthamoeba sp. UWC8]AIF81148.1 putative yrdC domain-containing protein [endosymbiont of Acanthamoeba sp. UWC8]